MLNVALFGFYIANVFCMLWMNELAMGTIGSSAESYAQVRIDFCVHIYATCYITLKWKYLNYWRVHMRYMKGNINIEGMEKLIFLLQVKIEPN